MIRSAIRTKFRTENPEITERVVTDATLNSLMLTANLEICVAARCITSLESQVINCVEGQRTYDLEEAIENFYDIDDMPGGGVYYDDVALKKSSPGEMNKRVRNWKIQDDGTPRFYWRRGKHVVLDRGPDDATIDLKVDCILTPDDFNNDNAEPFNGLQHLQPFCTSIVKYLQWMTKPAIGKSQEAAIAFSDFDKYVQWMKKCIAGYKYGPVYFEPKGNGSR